MGQHDPAFDAGAVFAGELDAFGGGDVHAGKPRIVERAEALFAAAIDACRAGFGRVSGLRRRECHAVERGGEGEPAEIPGAVRELLHRAARGGRAMQLRVAALGRGEVNVPAVRAVDRGIGDEIPCGGEVGHGAAFGRDAIQVHGGAEFLLRRDDLSETLAAAEHDSAAIGRPGRRIVLEAIVGQAMRLAFQVDGPQVGALVGVFVALMRIGGKGEGRGIGTPGGFARIHAEVRDLPGGAAIAGNDVEFVWRGGGRIARIGLEAAAVRLHVHPIVDAALEALLQLVLLRRGLMGRARRRGALEEGDPAIVGAEDGGSRHTANLKGFTRRAVHAQEPDVAFTGGGAASPATTLRPGR